MMVWLKNLNWIDILIIVLFLRSIILGFIHGSAQEFASLFRIGLNLAIPFFSHSFLAKLIINYLEISLFVAKVLSFVLIYLILHFLLSFLIRTRRVEGLSFLNRVAGGGMGLLKGAIIVFLLLLFLNFLPLEPLRKAIKDDSLLYRNFAKIKFPINNISIDNIYSNISY